MRWRDLLATASLVVLLAGRAADAAPVPDGPVVKTADGDLRDKVAWAIDRGARWLRRHQGSRGGFPDTAGSVADTGVSALCTLALLHTGVSRSDPCVLRAMRFLAQRTNRHPGHKWRSHRTYAVSLTIMVLARYARMSDGPGATVPLDPRHRAWLRRLTAWLVATQHASGGWRYPAGGTDNSCSQYAVLALREAKSAGAPVPRETFEKAALYFLDGQENDGPRVPRRVEQGGDGVYDARRTVAPGFDRARGWGYMSQNQATAAMTCAGVSSLAIVRRERLNPELAARAEQGMRDGLAWLGGLLDRKSPDARPDYYFLYSLERAGVLARVVYMGDRRWYADGARRLVRDQWPEGGWGLFSPRDVGPVGERSVVDAASTSFALLFLTRASSHAVAVATPSPGPDLSAGATLGDREHRQLFEAAFEALGRLPSERRVGRACEFALLGPRVIGYLLPKLSSASLDTRGRAILVLRGVTGHEIGYNPAGGEEAREEAVARWTAWYLLHRTRLRLNREKQRIE